MKWSSEYHWLFPDKQLDFNYLRLKKKLKQNVQQSKYFGDLKRRVAPLKTTVLPCSHGDIYSSLGSNLLTDVLLIWSEDLQLLIPLMMYRSIIYRDVTKSLHLLFYLSFFFMSQTRNSKPEYICGDRCFVCVFDQYLSRSLYISNLGGRTVNQRPLRFSTKLRRRWY